MPSLPAAPNQSLLRNRWPLFFATFSPCLRSDRAIRAAGLQDCGVDARDRASRRRMRRGPS
jgi:hypothetical protein